ncbi:hypothetical protein K466DRAFT_145342 [Polyporus arcularius HHB13444]|uniref:Uncharacterized protein n=1 Tax=Polyporus arcularius HHB13444 TaxID=1314778 RepID=A0A5C3PTV1_9APHY|nr:hypothetical protein K466DRAFT_145342 [Polyporus arcularius HHB13444]
MFLYSTADGHAARPRITVTVPARQFVTVQMYVVDDMASLEVHAPHITHRLDVKPLRTHSRTGPGCVVFAACEPSGVSVSAAFRPQESEHTAHGQEDCPTELPLDSGGRTPGPTATGRIRLSLRPEGPRTLLPTHSPTWRVICPCTLPHGPSILPKSRPSVVPSEAASCRGTHPPISTHLDPQAQLDSPVRRASPASPLHGTSAGIGTRARLLGYRPRPDRRTRSHAPSTEGMRAG